MTASKFELCNPDVGVWNSVPNCAGGDAIQRINAGDLTETILNRAFIALPPFSESFLVVVEIVSQATPSSDGGASFLIWMDLVSLVDSAADPPDPDRFLLWINKKLSDMLVSALGVPIGTVQIFQARKRNTGWAFVADISISDMHLDENPNKLMNEAHHQQLSMNCLAILSFFSFSLISSLC
jgi:hypothetical protein